VAFNETAWFEPGTSDCVSTTLRHKPDDETTGGWRYIAGRQHGSAVERAPDFRWIDVNVAGNLNSVLD
jgi:hypothetical protein